MDLQTRSRARQRGQSGVQGSASAKAIGRKIHPIVIYPYQQPRETRHLEELYRKLIRRVAREDSKYAKPLTVVNQQTYHRNIENAGFRTFLKEYVEPWSTVKQTWSVDTRQMWLHGFGTAFDERATVYDVYWLIPGDFFYADKPGQEVLVILG